MSRDPPDGEAIDDPAAPLALTAVRAGDDRKALDITALRVNHLTSATSFFVNMVGRSKAQINAIVKNVEDELEEQHGQKAHRQGKALGGWVCLDFDSVVVNVFSEAQRDFYGIDKFWAAAQPLDLSAVVTPNMPEAPSLDAPGAVEDDWELDDWSLDDWSLDDEEDDDGEWSLDDEAAATPFDFGTPSAASSAATAPDDTDLAGDGSVDLDGDNPFAEFTGERRPEEAPEAVISEGEISDDELREAGLLSSLDEDDDDAEDMLGDWFLGDEQLRALVQKAEQSVDEVSSAGMAAGSGTPSESAAKEGLADSPGGWRSMMEADGLSVDDEEVLMRELQGEQELASEEDEDDDLGLYT